MDMMGYGVGFVSGFGVGLFIGVGQASSRYNKGRDVGQGVGREQAYRLIQRWCEQNNAKIHRENPDTGREIAHDITEVLDEIKLL